MKGKSDAYTAAGVDIESASRTKKGISSLVRSTFGPEVLTDIGGFGGLFAPQWEAYRDPSGGRNGWCWHEASKLLL